jgi:hypothetical protein
MSVGYAIVAISWILGSIGLIAVDQPRSRMLPQPSGYVNRVKPTGDRQQLAAPSTVFASPIPYTLCLIPYRLPYAP